MLRSSPNFAAHCRSRMKSDGEVMSSQYRLHKQGHHKRNLPRICGSAMEASILKSSTSNHAMIQCFARSVEKKTRKVEESWLHDAGPLSTRRVVVGGGRPPLKAQFLEENPHVTPSTFLLPSFPGFFFRLTRTTSTSPPTGATSAFSSASSILYSSNRAALFVRE